MEGRDKLTGDRLRVFQKSVDSHVEIRRTSHTMTDQGSFGVPDLGDHRGPRPGRFCRTGVRSRCDHGDAGDSLSPPDEPHARTSDMRACW